MEMCNKRNKCVAKGICAININPKTYNCKRFHADLKELLLKKGKYYGRTFHKG
jgi:hypothetical protein